MESTNNTPIEAFIQLELIDAKMSGLKLELDSLQTSKDELLKTVGSIRIVILDAPLNLYKNHQVIEQLRFNNFVCNTDELQLISNVVRKTLIDSNEVFNRQITIQLPFENAIQLLADKFIYFNMQNCTIELDGILSAISTEKDWSRDEDFANYLSSVYGVSRLDVQNPIHDFHAPPQEIRMPIDEHSRALELITQATNLIDQNALPVLINRDSKLSTIRNLCVRMEEATHRLPSNDLNNNNQRIANNIKRMN